MGSIVLTATKASGAPSGATVSVVFAWMLFILCPVSAFLASRVSKQVAYRYSQTEQDPDEEDVEQDEYD